MVELDHYDGTARRWRKRPVVVEAIRWTGANLADVARFLGLSIEAAGDLVTPTGQIIITTLEGSMRANRYDFIIRGVAGELYPCKPEIFLQVYEPADAITVDVGLLLARLAEELGMSEEEAFALAHDLLGDDRGKRHDEVNT